MSSSAYATRKLAAPAHACFRNDLIVTPPAADSAVQRYQLYDPSSDLGFELGKAEYSLALLFDGHSSHSDIMASALARHRMKISPEKLVQFERKLLNL